MSTVLKGYECDFTSRPPDRLFYLCPICNLILREAHQTNCCQISFCRVCIERVEANNNPCPTCKKRVFCKHPDVRLQRELDGLQVTCTNKGQGCRWVGQLGVLDDHLNLNPEPSRLPEGCHYAAISCTYCYEPIRRFEIQVHQSQECDQRPTRCELCNYESTFADITKSHNCENYPELCHQCKQVFLRKDFKNHIDNDCPMTPIECEFKGVGCKIALPRKDMPTHLKESLITHVSLQMANQMKIEKENKKLKKQLGHQQQEIARLNKEVEETRTMLSTFQSMIQPIQFTMSQFSRLKRRDDDWISIPFYSHPQGYKMCVRVHANGILSGKGTHVSVYVHLMKGEFDDHQKWPFEGEVSIQIVSSKSHHTKSVVFDSKTPDEYASRVVRGERACQGWGNAEFISHADVGEYVWNDCLIFSVVIK